MTIQQESTELGTQRHDAAHWLDADQQRIWRTFLLASARISQHLDEDLRSHGLDLGEYEILVALEESEGHRARMSELAETVHQSRSRLTHTIARMERRGLVTRTSCPSDRRGVWAQLLTAGLDLLTRAAPSHVAAVRAVFVDVVDPADFTALGRAFGQVLEQPGADRQP